MYVLHAVHMTVKSRCFGCDGCEFLIYHRGWLMSVRFLDCPCLVKLGTT